MIRTAMIAFAATAILAAGASTVSAGSHVSFGIGIGIPGFYGGYPYGPYGYGYYGGYPYRPYGYYGSYPYPPYGYSYRPVYSAPLYGSRHVEACYARYRTYDARTDSFIGYDGLPHRCRIAYGY